MIVVDTSVWIAHLADITTPEVQRLRSIEQQVDVLVGDIVLLELLRGARSDQHALELQSKLGLYTVVEMLNEELAVAAAFNYRRLRALGSTIRSSVDLVIATYCIVHGHHLLQRDRDYRMMQAHLGLMLY